MAKVQKKAGDPMSDVCLHKTKKAANKVADFVKDHKKETLIATAVLAAIAGAFIISGALGGGAAATGGVTKKREDDKAPSSPPSDPPPLPDWVNDLFKSTSPDFSLDSVSEASLTNAKREAHDAWELFNHLKSETENDLASLKEFEPQFNLSSQAVNTILNAILHDAQKFESSKNFITSQSWEGIMKAGHAKIDQAFTTLSMYNKSAAVLSLPQKTSSSFIEKIQLGLEIICRGMIEPELLDLNSPLELFIKNEMDQKTNITFENSNQTIIGFLENIKDALRNDKNSFGNSILVPFQKQSLILPNDSMSISKICELDCPLSFGAVISSTQSRYFKTDGITEDGMLITFINGMMNTYEDAVSNAEYIRALCPGNPCIEGIYNHSSGPVSAILETIMLNYKGYSPFTKNLLIEKWTEFHEKNINQPDAKVLHFCHSQGSIHTKNALMQLSQEIQKRIIVVAIAPAKIISKKMCCDSFNYASEKDIVYLGDILTSYWNAYNEGDIEREKMLIVASKMHSELILLKPHEGAIGLDHEFQSLTFVERIKLHLENYIRGDYQ
jgi:hypothetical protein